jgi:hypothetical protein
MSEATCGSKTAVDIEDYIRLAKEMNNSNGLQGYLVVLQRVNVDGRVEICKEACVFPSFSHIAAFYDRPQDGIAVLDVKYVGVGKCALKGLVQKPMCDLTEEKHGDYTGT